MESIDNIQFPEEKPNEIESKILNKFFDSSGGSGESSIGKSSFLTTATFAFLLTLLMFIFNTNFLKKYFHNQYLPIAIKGLVFFLIAFLLLR